MTEEVSGKPPREVREHTYRAVTKLDLSALFEVTELSSDRMVAAHTLAFAPELVDPNPEGYPEFPPIRDMLNLACARVMEDIRPVLLEHVETRNLTFFNDETCGLDRAFGALKTGNYDRALEVSLANVASCQLDTVAEITQKDVAAAIYNVGVLYRIMGDFDSAMENLEWARQADPDNNVIAAAVGEALSAEAVAADLSLVRQDTVARAGQQREEAASRADPVITNNDADTDRAALVARYETTDGPNWGNNSRWLTDAPLSGWAGVHTDNSGRVTELRLSQNQLSGPLPPELGNLLSLTKLDLQGNDLSGPVPSSFVQLTRLDALHLSGNSLGMPRTYAFSMWLQGISDATMPPC